MKLRVVSALVLSVLLAACGGSSKPAAKSAPVVEKTPATPAPSPAAPEKGDAQPSEHTCCCPLASADQVEFNWTTPEACAEVGNECAEAASCAD